MSEPEFVELVLHGPVDRAVAFVEGFWRGADAAGPVWFTGREQVDHEGFMERLRERLTRDTHVILPKGLAEALIAELGKADTVQLEVVGIRPIDHGELAVEFECYTRDEAAAVRRTVEAELPERVRLEGYDVSEEVHDDARGVELYSPVHDYICRGAGRYVGPVGGIVAMARRLADQSFIHPGAIQLRYRA